jgi:hypothetical protein
MGMPWRQRAGHAAPVQGKLESPRPPIPLEILPAGEFDPVYRIPLDVQQGELPVLPLSIFGAVTMAHLPNTDSYLSGEWHTAMSACAGNAKGM